MNSIHVFLHRGSSSGPFLWKGVNEISLSALASRARQVSRQVSLGNFASHRLHSLCFFTGYVLYISFELLWYPQSSATMQRTLPFLRPLLTPKSSALRKHAHGLAPLRSSLQRPTGSTPRHPSFHHTNCLVPRLKGISQLKWQVRRESTQGSVTAREKEKQTKAPWHREGSDVPPVGRPRSAGAMAKGRIKPRLVWTSKIDLTPQESSLRHPHASSS